MEEFFKKGGPLMWPLLACSIIALTVAIERLIFWWREKRYHNEDLLDHLFRCAEQGDYEGAIKAGSGHVDASIRMLVSGLAHRQYGLMEAMEVAAVDEIDRMKAGLAVLDTIITMAPLLGILGTVTGIIHSFDVLGLSYVGDPREVVAGIAEALITTAAGLAIALMTLVPFNYCKTRVETETRRLEQLANRFEVAYKKGLPRETVERI